MRAGVDYDEVEMTSLIGIGVLLAFATAANAGQTPGQVCESGKNRDAGKYAACLSKAGAKLLGTRGSCLPAPEQPCYGDGDCPSSTTCEKDLGGYGRTIDRCEETFARKWARLDFRAEYAGDQCPDGLSFTEVKEAIDQWIASLAGGLAGNGLTTGASGFRGQVRQTGLTRCYDAVGNEIGCAGTNQDGELQTGLPAMFTDNGDGTISDAVTGLMWEKLGDDGSIHDKDNVYSWNAAFDRVATLNSGIGFAGYKDWRLPNINELQSVIDYASPVSGAHESLDTGCAVGCSSMSCSCTQPSYYWSTTSQPFNLIAAWVVDFRDGQVLGLQKTDTNRFTRAVRGGLGAPPQP